MKYSFLAIALFSSFAFAQTTLPECGKPCIDRAVPAETDCTVEDQACQCIPANKAAIQRAATSCVVEACGSRAIEVLQAANAICENLPAGGAETTETSATPSPTESEASETPAETSAPTASPTTSIDLETETGSMTIMPAPTGPGNATNTSTPPPQTVAPNAANALGAGVGPFVALGLAALAAL